MKKIERNAPCSCGSGKKFKHCCARRQAAESYNEKKRQSEAKLASLPPTPADISTSDLSTDKQIHACLDLIETELREKHVGSIFKLVDAAVEKLKMAPTFSYADLADATEADDRFEIAKRQLICLAGGDPVKLYVKRLGF